MHNIFVGDIGIRENNFINLVFFNQLGQIFFRIDGNALRIEFATEAGGIATITNVRNLISGKGDHLIIFIVAKNTIKVVKITASRAHDDDFSSFHLVAYILSQFFLTHYEVFDTVNFQGKMENNLALQLSHATEVAAIQAARAAGFGDKKKADGAAVKAMRNFFNQVDFKGRVVIGEGERDKAPMLFIGEKLGTGKGMAVDIAVDPLENTNATATLAPRAIAVLSASEKGGLFHAPDMYLNKLVVGPEAVGQMDIDAPVRKNLKILAKALERAIEDLVIVVLDRPRNEELITDIRKTGARVKLIPDGDLLPGIAVAMRGSGVHAVMGIGAAPEGVMTAAGLRCLKGEMQARFWPKNKEEEKRLRKMGGDPKRVYKTKDLASGKNIIFCATGVTNGDLLKGVRFFGDGARTHTLVMNTVSNKIRFIDTTHVFDKKTVEYRMY